MSDLDAKAVDHVLSRLESDPRLAWLLSPGSQAFDLLTAARAARLEIPLDVYRKRLDDRLTFQQLPPIEVMT